MCPGRKSRINRGRERYEATFTRLAYETPGKKEIERGCLGGEESLQGDPMRLDLPLISLLCKTIPATINWTWNNIFIAKFSFIFLFNKKKNSFVLGFSIY